MSVQDWRVLLFGQLQYMYIAGTIQQKLTTVQITADIQKFSYLLYKM